MSNDALTAVLAVSVTVHCRDVAADAQPSAHPAKTEPAAGAAVRVTAAPAGQVDAQVAPQPMPAGVLVTDPEPAP